MPNGATIFDVSYRIEALAGLPMTLSWHNGHWAECMPSLPVNDYGVLQAAAIVERLRSFNGRLHFLDRHMDRLLSGCAALGITLPLHWDVPEIAAELARRSYGAADQDIGLVILVTPGVVGAGQPTVLLHDTPLPWARLKHCYQAGQSLIQSDRSVAPHNCWPPSIKHRSRLNYYLADQAASGDAFVGAVLSDSQGNLQDTSIANLILVQNQRLIVAPPDEVLHGISVQTTHQLASAIGMDVVMQRLSPELVDSADEMLLVGSLGCIWSCSEFGGRQYPGPEGAVYARLSEAWKEEVVCDFVSQAIQLGSAR